jgi:signal peptidase I
VPHRHPVSTDGYQDRPAASADSGATGVGQPGHGSGAHRARSPRVADHRTRDLGYEPSDDTPVRRTAARTDKRPQRRRRYGSFLASVAGVVIVAALAVWLLQAFVVQPFSVPGQTMAPAIQGGDRILIVKLGLLEGAIHSGEIVVFRSPKSMACTVAGVGGGGDLVLRVVALSGQTIWSVNNTIFVDGRVLRERGWYDPRSGEVGPTRIPRTTLGPNQYFVMADNRSGACDSRAFGPISKSSIVGRGLAIVARHGDVFFRRL